MSGQSCASQIPEDGMGLLSTVPWEWPRNTKADTVEIVAVSRVGRLLCVLGPYVCLERLS